MRGIRPTACLIVVVFSANAFGQSGVEIRSATTGAHGTVAAGRKTAVAAGIEILGHEGNAVDAAAATILVQSVVKSRSFSFGGEVPWLVYDAKRDVVEVVCGQGTAPQLANLEWFQKHNDGKIPRGDPSSAAVPAVLHACLTALDRYGTMQFADVAGPMLRALDRDEPQWNGDLAAHIRAAIEAEAQAADRSQGLAAVIDYFYRGPAARSLDAWCKKNSLTMKTFILSLSLLSWPLNACDAANDTLAIQADMTFFTDASCSQLKPGVQLKDLDGFQSELLKTVAAGMLYGSYDTTYRAAGYEAYPSPCALGDALKLGDGFSRYENITGICLEPGEHVVFVGSAGGKELSLLIPDWMRKPAEGIKPTKDPDGWGLQKQRIGLREGVNVIQVEKGGNVYVSYFDDHAETAPEVRVHFPTGKVNGFFDASKHTNGDWNRLLDNAISPILDARGKHIQVAYPVEWFNVYTRGKGVELIANYDRLLHSHYTLMGLVKYNKVPKNRILARVNFNYYMFRDRDGVAYLGNKSTMRKVADPEVVITGDPCWGFCHEVGHVLQMRPQLTWGGMTEVSCNIFSMYTVTGMGNRSRLKAQNNYASARKAIIEASPKISYLACRGVFDRLVPFWQLHLYFSRHGKPDFYADVMEQMRLRPDAGSGDESIRNQFEFVKICCDVGELDLTDFFDKWGFFWVGDLTVKDYGTYHYTITQQMVDDTKSYITNKKYKKPAEDITLIEE